MPHNLRTSNFPTLGLQNITNEGTPQNVHYADVQPLSEEYFFSIWCISDYRKSVEEYPESAAPGGVFSRLIILSKAVSCVHQT